MADDNRSVRGYLWRAKLTNANEIGGGNKGFCGEVVGDVEIELKEAVTVRFIAVMANNVEL